MNICFVQTSVYPLFNKECKEAFGGSEVQVYLIGKELAKNENAEVSFLVGDYGQKKVEEYDQICVYRGVTPSSNFMTKVLQLLKLFWLLMKIDPDVIIQRTANVGTGLIAFYAQLFGKKFVYMVASNIDVDKRHEKLLGTIGGRVYRWGISKADVVVAQSKSQMEALKRKFNKDSVVIKSGYPLSPCPRGRCRAERSGARQRGREWSPLPLFEGEVPVGRRGCFSDKKYILWVGRGEDIKRPDIFINLAEQNPDFSFVIICLSHRDKAYFEMLKKRADKLQNTSFISHVPFDEIDQYFKRAKVLVNTSDFEGFPNTFIQAAKNKTPMLSLNSNPDNFLEKYKCGFCADGDKEVLNSRLNVLMNNIELHKKYSENAYRYAKENHDIKKNAAKLEKVIFNLVK